MKKVFASILLCAVIALDPVIGRAQQIPFLSEVFSRYEEFNRLYKQKRGAGANLSAIEPLRRQGEEAFKRGSIPGILETLGQALAVLQGKAWDERQKFIASLTLEVDRLVIEPNREIQVSLVKMFPASIEKAFAAAPTVTFEVKAIERAAMADAKGEVSQRLSVPMAIATRLPIAEASTIMKRRLLLPDDIYWVIARIESGGQTVAELRRPLYAISDFSERANDLASQIAAIKNSTDPKVKAAASALATPEFQLQRLAQLNSGVTDYDVNPNNELQRLDQVLSFLAKGENLLANRRGELERAYRASDGTVVPYRLYVPKSYDGTSARPLVVMLHGALGDETYYFSGLFDPAAIKSEAERRGFILAAPNGRGRLSDYRGPAQEDVFEVIKAAMQDYKIDPSRVYITGHSMGGFGAWLIASSKPEMFAALASVSAGPPAQSEALAALLQKVKSTPALLVHGARDGIAPPSRSRDMLAAAQKAGLKISLLEAPDADHITVVATTFAAVMDFFEKNSKPPASQ